VLLRICRQIPRLVHNRNYLDKHEEVREFLRHHPAVRAEIANNSRRVFGRYYIDDRRDYADNRPQHRWEYRYGERRDDRLQRNDRNGGSIVMIETIGNIGVTTIIDRTHSKPPRF